jgi:hypothetical protein
VMTTSTNAVLIATMTNNATIAYELMDTNDDVIDDDGVSATGIL